VEEGRRVRGVRGGSKSEIRRKGKDRKGKEQSGRK
jgi:hypothetical protein